MMMIYHIFLLNIFLIWCVSSLTGFSGIGEETVEWNSIVADDLVEDDHGDFELSHIIALSADYPDIPEDAPKPEERIEVVELHNILRRNYTYPFPNVSNIPMLEYNNTAEFMAGEMLKLCEYKHVFGAAENMSGITGQNLYSGHTHMVSRALYNFYHLEIGLFYFNNYSCTEPQVMFGCGHFVTMTQALSEHVGFHRKSNCFPLEEGEAHYLHAYHYYIGGVLWNKECIHYKYGPPCTRCKPGYLCATGLCVPDPKRRCEDYNLDCECKRVCHNCARPNWKDCKCTTCKLGWDWDDCSYPCYDWAVKYYKNRNYCKRQPSSRCFRREPWFQENRCRQHCKRCFLVKPDSNPDELCCGGKICDLYYILDLDTCECKMLSPNPNDLYPYNTTTTVTVTSQQSTVKTEPRPSTIASTVSTTTVTSQKPTAKKETQPFSTASTFSAITVTSQKPTVKKETQPFSTASTFSVITVTSQKPTVKKEPRPFSITPTVSTTTVTSQKPTVQKEPRPFSITSTVPTTTVTSEKPTVQKEPRPFSITSTVPTTTVTSQKPAVKKDPRPFSIASTVFAAKKLFLIAFIILILEMY